MNALKYIIDDIGGFMIFSNYVKHNDAARTLQNSSQSPVVSAGFCHFDENSKIVCYGYSQSLKLQSRPEDSEIIQSKL